MNFGREDFQDREGAMFWSESPLQPGVLINFIVKTPKVTCCVGVTNVNLNIMSLNIVPSDESLKQSIIKEEDFWIFKGLPEMFPTISKGSIIQLKYQTSGVKNPIKIRHMRGLTTEVGQILTGDKIVYLCIRSQNSENELAKINLEEARNICHQMEQRFLKGSNPTPEEHFQNSSHEGDITPGSYADNAFFMADVSCNVCYNRKINTLLPCNHAYLCNICAQDILESTAVCPICRRMFSRFRQFNAPWLTDVELPEMGKGST